MPLNDINSIFQIIKMKKIIPSYVRVPVIFFIIFGAMEYFIDSGDRAAF
jgi:cytochrome c oxidase cbb3-type subunit 3